jgi:hypothetical protein
MMDKLIYRLMSIFVTFVLVLGSSYSAGASSAYGAPMTQSQATALPAFPGAEGFGANTIGGRGGAIFEVTNLNDSGAGSLRACVQASGARTCVFRIGGLIVLQSPLKIVNPYITIAGQTAPGGGITIKLGSSTEVFLTQTHDVIIRYITSRPGPGGENHANQIAKSGTELYNIIIDHNSLSWGVDSNIETWYRVQGATIQWSIISEGLNDSTHSKGEHSKGIMIGGYKGSDSGGKGSENISILNNLMAHNADRNPLMQLCGIAQVINNVTYNPIYTFSHQQLNCLVGESYVNWINNYHKKGPSSTSSSDLKIIPSDDGVWSPGKVYLEGNIGPSRLNDSLPETNWVEVKSGAPAGVIVTSPAPAPAVHSTSAIEAYNSVIADGGVGNSQGLGCDGSWYSRRDSIDTRVINDVKNGTGKIIDDPAQVGGWIVPATGVPCTDSDHDGMPDVWEQAYGFNPNIPDGSGDKDGDGYTNVEEYLNGADAIPSTPWVGSVSITSNKKVAAVGRPHIGSEIASYDGFSAGAHTAYVPMLFKNAFANGAYDSAFYIQNVDSALATISIKYYDSVGDLTCTAPDTIEPLASKGYWLPGLSAACLPDGWVGGVVVTSDKNIVANGRPHIAGEVMTYDGFSSGSLTSYLPMLFKNVFANGAYDSAFYIQNVHASNTANLTIDFYDSAGTLSCTKVDTVAPLASKGYWVPSEDCLPDGWVGGVVVTSDQPIITVGRPHIGSQITTYNGFSGGSLASYIPMLFKNAFGGSYNSAFYVQNVDASNTADLIIKYYDSTGILSCTINDSIAPLASKGYWVPGETCIPVGWTGSVKVTSSQPIVTVGRPHIGTQVTTYNGFSSGSLNSYLPMLFKDAFGGSYDSAFYIQNTETSAASITIKFYDNLGALTCTRNETLPAFSTFNLWVPDITCLE